MKIGIIGGGPAGMSAALWLRQLGMDALLLEKGPSLGGLLNLAYRENCWVLGLADSTGPRVAQSFAGHLGALGIQPMLSTRIRSLRRLGEDFQIDGEADGKPFSQSVAAIVLALGTRVRGQEVLAGLAGGREVDQNALICGPEAFRNLGRYAQQRVLVIGGGDNAHEFIQLTSDLANSYVMLVRSERRAQHRFAAHVDELVGQGRCRVHEHCALTSISTVDGQLSAEFAGHETGTVLVDAIVVLIGYEPEARHLESFLSPALLTELRLDASGYVVTDPFGRTTCRGIYAAGDVTNPPLPSVVTALAAGALAARTIERDFSPDVT